MVTTDAPLWTYKATQLSTLSRVVFRCCLSSFSVWFLLIITVTRSQPKSASILSFKMFSLASLLVVSLTLFATLSFASPTALLDTVDTETDVPDLLPRATCPSVWTTIASDLRNTFRGCQQPTRFAIRFAFHDAGAYSSRTPFYAPAAGGADGSLLLNAEEIARSSQNPMQNYRNFLLGKYNTYKSQGVTAADLVQFAGSLAIASCPGGPIVPTVSIKRSCDVSVQSVDVNIGRRQKGQLQGGSGRFASLCLRGWRRLRRLGRPIRRQGFLGYRPCSPCGRAYSSAGICSGSEWYPARRYDFLLHNYV